MVGKQLNIQKSIFHFLWIFSFLVSFSAHAQIQAVASGQTVTIDAHGVCWKLTNNGGGTVMVPYRSAGEWSSYINGRPSFISLTSCAPPCGGAYYAGYCWYTTPDQQSCDTRCAGRGGVNYNGTVNFAGSGGSLANCLGAAAALGLPTAGAVSSNYNNIKTGCSIFWAYTYPNGYAQPTKIEWVYPATTSTGQATSRGRICACNN